MAAEHTTERAKDAFRIENLYSAKSIFSRLESDELYHSFSMDNNWNGIRTHNYDPILSLDVHVVSRLAESTENDEKKDDDKRLRSYKFEAQFRFRSRQGDLDVNKLSSSLDKSRSDFDYTSRKDDDLPGVNYHYFVMNKPGAQPATLRFVRIDKGVYEAQLLTPSINTFLENSDELSIVQEDFFNNLEDVIKAIYDYEGKEVPQSELEFKAVPENSPFMAKCNYCSSVYDAYHESNCPHCGAPDPTFIFKE